MMMSLDEIVLIKLAIYYILATTIILWLNNTRSIFGVMWRAFWEIVFGLSFNINNSGERSARRIKRHSRLTGKDEMVGFSRYSKESIVLPKNQHMVVKMGKKEKGKDE